jgi:predicted esterase YcpF (UPF0227 family)
VSATPFELNSRGGFVEAGSPPDLVVYMHGFRSSPASSKAQQVMSAFQNAGLLSHLWVPQLPASPQAAIDLIVADVEERLQETPELTLAFIGSSLGGFYATVLGERYTQAKVVLLNPAVNPHVTLQNQLGTQQVYLSEEEIEFVPAYLSALQNMQVHTLTHPQRYFLMAAQQDEVLSFNEMVGRFPQAHQLRLFGSNHALTEFEDFLPFVNLFLGVR